MASPTNSLSKRLFDVFAAGVAFVAFLPLLGLIALLLRLHLGAPPLFRQSRPGLFANPFKLYKFRTMKDTMHDDGTLLPDKERLTSLGRLLRATSLDELPELVNVLKGDMSLVGPRPLLEKYLPYYTERERLRHTVKPGITGWAQVHGRNFLPWNERLAMDVWYVEHWSLWLDLRILAMTIVAVMTSRGVAPDVEAVESDLDYERRDRVPYS